MSTWSLPTGPSKNVFLAFDIRLDAEGYLKGVREFAKQIPYAEQIGLNNTAFIVRAALQAKIKDVFDRPTKRTINSPWVKKADAKAPERFVLIGVNNDSDKTHISAADYLRAQIEGGSRKQKRGEGAILQHTIMGATDNSKNVKYFVPSKFAPSDDGHGNLPGSVWTNILSDLRALSESGFEGNRRGKAGRKGGGKSRPRNKGNRYFVSETKPMVMMRFGQVAVPILVGIKTAAYDKRLPWYETIDKVWNANIEDQLQKAIAHAINTAW